MNQPVSHAASVTLAKILLENYQSGTTHAVAPTDGVEGCLGESGRHDPRGWPCPRGHASLVHYRDFTMHIARVSSTWLLIMDARPTALGSTDASANQQPIWLPCTVVTSDSTTHPVFDVS